jgi:hypothetical protein
MSINAQSDPILRASPISCTGTGGSQPARRLQPLLATGTVNVDAAGVGAQVCAGFRRPRLHFG